MDGNTLAVENTQNSQVIPNNGSSVSSHRIFFILTIIFFLAVLVFLVYYNGKSIYAHGL